jgi:hypothetical protein
MVAIPWKGVLASDKHLRRYDMNVRYQMKGFF